MIDILFINAESILGKDWDKLPARRVAEQRLGTHQEAKKMKVHINKAGKAALAVTMAAVVTVATGTLFQTKADASQVSGFTLPDITKLTDYNNGGTGAYDLNTAPGSDATSLGFTWITQNSGATQLRAHEKKRPLKAPAAGVADFHHRPLDSFYHRFRLRLAARHAPRHAASFWRNRRDYAPHAPQHRI